MTLLPFEPAPASQPATGFAEFWIGWPKKVGKRDAERAWRPACKRDTPENIIAGRDLYIANKPAWQEWMHPATFLRGDRWKDEYEAKFKRIDHTVQSLETAARKIRLGTGNGFALEVSQEQARQCVDEGLVTEEQAWHWL